MRRQRVVAPWRCRHAIVGRRGTRWICPRCGDRFAEAWKVDLAHVAAERAEERAARKIHEAEIIVKGQQLAWAEVFRVFGIRKRQHLLDIGHALQAQARRGVA